MRYHTSMYVNIIYLILNYYHITKRHYSFEKLFLPMVTFLLKISFCNVNFLYLETENVGCTGFWRLMQLNSVKSYYFLIIYCFITNWWIFSNKTAE